MTKLDWYGKKISLFERQAAEEGLKEAAEGVLTEANKSVPHDEGTLERSGTAQAKGLKATISYDTPYAAYLHENPQFDFQGKGEGKWLEKTVKDSAMQKKVKEHVAKKIDNALS